MATYNGETGRPLTISQRRAGGEPGDGSRKSDQYRILGHRTLEGESGHLYVTPLGTKMKGNHHKLWYSIPHMLLISLLILKKSIVNYLSEVTRLFEEKMDSGEIRNSNREESNAFATRQCKSPFRHASDVGEGKGLFVFTSAAFEETKTALSFVVKIMDCRADPKNGALFPKPGTKDVVSIESGLFLKFLSKIPDILEILNFQFLKHRELPYYCACRVCHCCRKSVYEINIQGNDATGKELCHDDLQHRVSRQIKSVKKYSIASVKTLLIKIVFPPAVTGQDKFYFGSDKDEELSVENDSERFQKTLREYDSGDKRKSISPNAQPLSSSTVPSYPHFSPISSASSNKSGLNHASVSSVSFI